MQGSAVQSVAAAAVRRVTVGQEQNRAATTEASQHLDQEESESPTQTGSGVRSGTACARHTRHCDSELRSLESLSCACHPARRWCVAHASPRVQLPVVVWPPASLRPSPRRLAFSSETSAPVTVTVFAAMLARACSRRFQPHATPHRSLHRQPLSRRMRGNRGARCRVARGALAPTDAGRELLHTKRRRR